MQVGPHLLWTQKAALNTKYMIFIPNIIRFLDTRTHTHIYTRIYISKTLTSFATCTRCLVPVGSVNISYIFSHQSLDFFLGRSEFTRTRNRVQNFRVFLHKQFICWGYWLPRDRVSRTTGYEGVFALSRTRSSLQPKQNIQSNYLQILRITTPYFELRRLKSE
jgi:hypothetical protein